MRKYVEGPILKKYLNKVNERRQKGFLQEITIEEIEIDILNRMIPQKINGEYCYGIYGYFDKKLKIWVYVGKDKYILQKVRNTQHWTTNKQPIDNMIQKNPERYVFKIIDIIPSSNILEADVYRADIWERHYIKEYNTYYYENPQGMNFTKGGETSFGIETEANIDHDKINRKIKSKKNSTYKGERDGKDQLHGVYTFGNDGDTFILSTNGGGDRGTQYSMRNEKEQHKKVLQSMDLNTLFKNFNEEGYTTKSTIKVSDTFREKFPNFNIKEYGF